MDPKIASIVVLALTFVAWILTIVVMAGNNSVADIDIPPTPQFPDGFHHAVCGVYSCDGCGNTAIKFFLQSFMLGLILTLSLVGIIHILQVVNVLSKIVPEKHHEYIKYLHLFGTMTAFSCMICIIVYYTTVDCSWWRDQHDTSIGFGTFLLIFVILMEGVNFFLLYKKSMGLENGCAPLMNSA
eukprot:TRINITY_DN46310_c0_g1_i1.p2 TRINITY_DN46310_c0_g1~~TRINITY_DN46310_c0_g1_i1.p2  ORF type:complete len:184 (+),score=75.52 TRINITY_DN46310_c0_g1_i1:62-613(+)